MKLKSNVNKNIDKNKTLKVDDKVLCDNNHTCCICNECRKDVQIHHIDRNRSNNAPNNLAVLCLDCHSKVHNNGGLGRHITLESLINYKNDWETFIKKKFDIGEICKKELPHETWLTRGIFLYYSGFLTHSKKVINKALDSGLSKPFKAKAFYYLHCIKIAQAERLGKVGNSNYLIDDYRLEALDFYNNAVQISNKYSIFPQSICNNYEVLSIIGEGGMSIVYKVKEINNGQIRIVKFFKHSLQQNFNLENYFKKNKEKLIKLSQNSDYMPQIYEVITETEKMSIIMEYIEGYNLLDYIRINADKFIKIENVIEFFIEICKGVNYLHQKDIIHGDIKPSNIIIEQNGEIKLIDFELSKSIFTDIGYSTLAAAPVTAIYGAPEVIKNGFQQQTKKSDIFSLGKIFEEMLTNFSQFKVDLVLKEIINTAIDNEPDRRFNNIADLISVLKKHVTLIPELRFFTTFNILYLGYVITSILLYSSFNGINANMAPHFSALIVSCLILLLYFNISLPIIKIENRDHFLMHEACIFLMLIVPLEILISKEPSNWLYSVAAGLLFFSAIAFIISFLVDSKAGLFKETIRQAAWINLIGSVLCIFGKITLIYLAPQTRFFLESSYAAIMSMFFFKDIYRDSDVILKPYADYYRNVKNWKI